MSRQELIPSCLYSPVFVSVLPVVLHDRTSGAFLGDDSPTLVGLGVDHPLRRGDVLAEHGERILHSDHLVPVALQEGNDVLPRRPVGEGTVNEYDRRLLGAGHATQRLALLGWD